MKNANPIYLRENPRLTNQEIARLTPIRQDIKSKNYLDIIDSIEQLKDKYPPIRNFTYGEVIDYILKLALTRDNIYVNLKPRI